MEQAPVCSIAEGRRRAIGEGEERGQGEGEEREGEPMDAVDEDEAAMMAMMGFGGFNTTKVSYIESV